MPFFQMQALSTQVILLLLLAIPVACISWTVTHEEMFREPREPTEAAIAKGSISANSSLF
jgi:hypothetical protein